MNNWFRDLPIRSKLSLLMLLTITIVLIITRVALLLYEQEEYRDSMIRDMTVICDMAAYNDAPALEFDDANDAATNLHVLAKAARVTGACIYDGTDGSIFASYERSGSGVKFPAKPPPDGAVFTESHLSVSRPVLAPTGRRIGTIHLQADLEGLRERVRLHVVLGVVVLLVSGLLTLVLAAIFQRSITAPIRELAETARGISERKDYTVRAVRRSNDETGRLTDAFNLMLDEIEGGQGALQRANQTLRAQAAQLTESAGVLLAQARRMLDFSSQVAAIASGTAAAVEQASRTVGEVRQTAQVTNQKARLVAENAQRAVQISASGSRSTEETAAGMKRIRHQMDSIGASMAHLSEQTQAIGEIITTVDDIAAQSNLLAVNAAIEAAKAGEQGRGFGVVAQEVRTLAEQSKQATMQVRNILHEITRATGAAVAATEQGGKAVEAGVEQSAQAGASIQVLAASVSESAQSASQIAASSQQQYAGMDQVAAAMESIRHASEQNVLSARQVEAAARELNDVGQKLRELVDRSTAAEPAPRRTEPGLRQ